MKKATLLLVLFAILAISVPASAGDNDNTKQISASKAGKTTFEGTLVCVGCDLKKNEGARAACKTTGCNHAIKTSDGKYINLLENQYSSDLIKGGDFHNKQIKVEGVYFAKANLLDVESYTIDGKQKNWCGHCSKMDGCMASKGKM
ncbi:MAG: hypothetical protein KAR42_06195 [candidate division Zixibacteria bacterium]|nr:hypothetical protein [candidate division Zixibacteria bacterium]